MASTVIQFDAYEESLPSISWMERDEPSQVAGNAAGYVISAVPGQPSRFQFTVADACDGIYRIPIANPDGVVIGVVYADVEDTVGPFHAELSRSAFIGVSSGGGSVDLSGIESTLADIQTDISTVQSTANGIDTVVDGLVVTSNAIQVSINGVASDVDGLEVDFVGFESDLDALQQAVGNIGSCIATSPGILLSPVQADNTLPFLYRASTYSSAHGLALSWDTPAVPGILPGDAGAKLGLYQSDSEKLFKVGSISENADGSWKMLVQIDANDTIGLLPGNYDWTVGITLAGNILLPRYGGRVRVVDNFMEETRAT